MLGKLMKYEFSALSRILPPAYGVVLVLSGIGHFWFAANLDIKPTGFLGVLFGLFISVYVLSIVASILLTFFLVVQRFYKSMACDEGYLTHTLPVPISAVVGAKLLSGYIWMLAGVLCALLSLAVLLLNRETWAAAEKILGSYSQINELFTAQNGLSVIQMLGFVIVLMLAGLLAQVLVFYASVALGQLFSKQKLLGSILGYMGINVASQLLSVFMLMTALLMTGNIPSLFGEPADAAIIAVPSLIAALLLQLIVGGGCWLLTTWIMKRRLNLE